MNKDNFEQGWEMNRRNVLRTVGVMGAVGTFGLPAFSGSVAASSHVTETLYLSHSVDSENVTKLFSVDLDSISGEAVLDLVTSIGGNFQNVDAIAATSDGETVMFIDRNTAHLGEYDVSADSFSDKGAITGLPTITVLAAYGLDGNLYVASNNTNKLYTVDDSVSPPVATEVGTITGATVNGADIVVDSTGTMFLHSNADDTLYTVDYQNPDGSGNVAATVVGSDPGSSLTGLAVRAAGTGDLVGSSRTEDAIIVIDKTDGTRMSQHDMTFNGNAYSYTNGDMATGVIIDETCDECTSEELLAKYEFACVEEVDGECVDYDFVFEKGDDTLVTYEPGSFMSKDDEAFEPVSATFGTDYCTVYAVVKAGQEIEVQELVADDGEVTAEYVAPYAISFVAFYCTEAAAQDAADAFPAKGKDN
jgi:hypothetical protein